MTLKETRVGNGPKRLACNFCRQKKIRCNGGQPCTNCLDHNEVCVTATKRRSRKPKVPEDVDYRLLKLEGILQSMQKSGVSEGPEQTSSIWPSGSQLNDSQNNEFGPTNDRQNPPWITSRIAAQEAILACSSSNQSQQHQLVFESCSTNVPDPKSPTIAFNSPSDGPRPPLSQPSRSEPEGLHVLEGVSNARSSPLVPQLHDHSLSEKRNGTHHSSSTPGDNISLLEPDISSVEEGGSVYSGETTNWEYHGPRSWLSICSKPAVQWVMDKTDTSSFQDAASEFAKDITRRLKSDIDISQKNYPDPPPETAWLYTQAYFEESTEAAFGIVHRPWFENKLQLHLANPLSDNDPTWYALRNAIFATGCRIVLSRTRTFKEAKKEAWRYFQNALSVHLQLLYLRTSLLSVQIMTIMTAFTGSIGSPCLEYMLCAISLRLACSKGLHRESVGAWDLSPHEACHRNWVFWAIYCLERQIVSRSGRPPMIHDDDISCQIPTSAPAGGSVNVHYCQIAIKLAQFSSIASQNISPKDAFRKGPRAFAATICEINGQLSSWQQAVNGVIDFNGDINLSNLPGGLTLQQCVHLYFCYYNVVLEIQSALILPWFKALFGPKQQEILRPAYEVSAEKAAVVCRKAILMTKHVHINANISDLVAFHGPMNALIHLFIHTLERPHLPTAKSDLALIEFGAGHFARLEYDTNSEYPVPFARRIADLARLAVERANMAPLPVEAQSLPARDMELAIDPSLTDFGTLEEDFQVDMDLPWNQSPTMNAFDLELENWSALVPTWTPPGLMATN